MPPEIDFVPDVQNDEGAPGAIDFQPDQAAALFGPSSLDLRPTFIPTLPPAETSPKLEAAKEMALALPQAFGIGLGAVEKGVGAAIGRIAGTGDTLEDVKRAIEEGEPLPVELSAAKARGIGGTLARVGLGLAETAPKIASLALFPGGILAQSIAAGGIFGLDAQGRFSPRAAAVGALLPGAGALAKGTVARALAGAMERGTIGTMHPATQWITEEMGHQAALNAVMLTADSPELIELYHTDRDAFRRKIEDTIGMNLAFGLFGGIKRLRGAPTATQEYVRKNAEKFGKIADNMITQQIVGGAGQQAIEQAIAEAKSRQKYAGFIKFPGDEDVAGSAQPMPPSGEEPPGFVPVAGPQLPPIEPKGPENAVQIGIPAPLPVEVPPQTGAQVVGQVRKPEEPAEARPPAEPPPPPVEPAKPVEPPKQPDVPQLSGLPEDIQQLFAGTPPPPKKKSIPIVIEIDGVQQPAYFEGYGTTATSLEPINPWISRLSEGGWTTGPIQPDAKIVWGKIPEAPKPAEEKPPEKAPEAEKPAAEPPAIDRSRTFTEQEAEDAGIASQLAREGWSFNLFDRKWSFKQTEPPKATEPEEKPEEISGERGVVGNAFSVVTPENDVTAKGNYELIDLSKIIISDQPGYAPELQPRDRSRQASIEQIEKIEREINPARLAESPTSDVGSPILNNRNMALTGNGRLMAIRLHYDRGNTAYRDWLLQNLGNYGIDPAEAQAMDRPVLVRRGADFGTASEAAFSEKSNRSSVAGMSDAEKARSDAMFLDRNPNILDLFLPSDTGDILAETNRPFLQAFVNSVSDKESLLTKSGWNPLSLPKRVKNALLAMVLGPERSGLITDLVENATELNVANSVTGLMRSIPKLMKLRGSSYDVTTPLGQALSDLVTIRRTSQKVENFLASKSMFGDEGRTAQSDSLLYALAKARSAKQIEDVLGRYIRTALEARADEQSGGLFGENPKTAEEVLKIANEKELGKTEEPPGEPPSPAGEPVKPPTPPVGPGVQGAVARPDPPPAEAPPELAENPVSATSVSPGVRVQYRDYKGIIRSHSRNDRRRFIADDGSKLTLNPASLVRILPDAEQAKRFQKPAEPSVEAPAPKPPDVSAMSYDDLVKAAYAGQEARRQLNDLPDSLRNDATAFFDSGLPQDGKTIMKWLEDERGVTGSIGGLTSDIVRLQKVIQAVRLEAEATKELRRRENAPANPAEKPVAPKPEVTPESIRKQLNRGYYDDPSGATWKVQQADNGQWYVERTFNGVLEAGRESYDTIEEAQASAVEQIQGKPPIQPPPPEPIVTGKVLWGRLPGEPWVKLSDNVSKAEQARRTKDGWEVAVMPKGESPQGEEKTAPKPATEPKLSDRERQRLSDLQMKDRANRDAIGRGELGDPLNPEEQREYDDLIAKAGQRTLFDVEEVVATEERPVLEGKLRNLEEKLAEMKRQQLLSLTNSQNRQMGGDKAKEFLNAAKTYEKRISETINEIADIKRKLRIGLTAEEEAKATPPEKPAEDDLFSQPAPKPKSAAPAKPSEGAMREEIADLERKLALLDAEWQDANAKNRKKKAREIGQQISDLGNRLNLLKSDLTEGQGEIVLRTPIAENPTTGEYESREYRLRQMTSQEFLDYFTSPEQRMREFGDVYTPWRAEMRRVYYDESGKETRHDAWYIDAIHKTRDGAIEKAASYSGRSAEGWKEVRDTLNKPKGPEISPEQPSAPISAGKEGVSKGAGATAQPVKGLSDAESARLAELTDKVESGAKMTKAERDRFVELQKKAGAREEGERPEVRSGEDEPPNNLFPAQEMVSAAYDAASKEPHPAAQDSAVANKPAKVVLQSMFDAGMFDKRPAIKAIVKHILSRFDNQTPIYIIEHDQLGERLLRMESATKGESSVRGFFSNGRTTWTSGPAGELVPVPARNPRGIYLVKGVWNTRGNGATVRTFLHEYIHAITSDFITDNPNDPLVRRLLDLARDVRIKLYRAGMEMPYGVQGLELYGSGPTPHMGVHEFIAEGLANRGFQEMLGTLRAPRWAITEKISTAWQTLVDTIRQILGLKRGTMLEDTVRTSLELLEKSAPKASSEAARAPPSERPPDAAYSLDWLLVGEPNEGVFPSFERRNAPPETPTPEGERPGGPKMGITQVAREKVGVERPMEFIAGIRQRLRTGYFDGSQPVEPVRTENAWEIAQRMVNPETKGAFASELQRAGGGEMAPGLLRNELWDYAVRQAVRGDTSLMEFMVRRSQDFQTLAGEALANGDTALGRGLRAARDRAFGGMWSRLTAFRNEQLAVTSRRLQQGEAGLQQIIEAIDGLVASIGDIDAFERELRTPELQRVLDSTSETRQAADAIVSGETFIPPERRSSILETVYQWMSREVDPQADRTPFTDTLKAELQRLRLNPEQAQTIADATWNRKLTVDGAIRRRLWDRELRRLDNLAEKTADAFILSVDQAEWKRPEQVNEVRDIIKEALKSEAPLDSNNVLGFKRDLTQRLLTAGLSEGKARDLANAITKRRETDLLNAQLRVRDRAVQSKSLKSLVESIKSSPYLAQQDPEWRFDTAVRWFESNGLSREQAQEAAKMFDAQFVSALTRAAEQAAKRLILKGDYGRNVPELVEAVRLGLTDPSKEWTEEIAKREGFRPLTPEAQQRLATLEEKYSNPNLSAHEQVALVEQMMGIVRHAGDPKGRVMKIMGESFAASLLSGIRTITLNWLQPWFTMVTTGAAHGVFEPRDFGTVVRSMWNASKNWWPEYKYAWSKDAYELSSEEQVFHSNALKTAFEDAQKNWAKGNYSKAVLEFAYGWQQYVIRGLQAADQAGMAVAREWKMALYGSIAMREAGLRTSQISELVDVAAGFKRAEYERALYDGKTHNEAQVIANEATIDAMTNFFENKLGSRRKAEAVEEAALYDAFNIVGRRAPGVDETAEGFLSRYSGLNRVMRFVSETRREGGGASILTIMAVGFMNVPMRTARFYAGFSPYGILRYGIDKYRTNRGQDPHWKQSFANEYQSKARLREALVGTSMMLAFLGWQHRHHTSDDDAEKKAFAMYVTGSGPSNKTMRDAWIKRGFEPYTLHIVANGAVRSKLPVNRVGQILAFPLGLAASLDDLAWRRKQEQAISPGKKEFAGREIVAAMGTYYNIVGAQGVLQAFSHLSQIGQGQSGTGRAVGVSLASTGSALAIPGKSLIQGVTDMMFGAVDRSSVEAAMMANVPVLNALWNGQAINRFGDQIGDRTWSARLSKLGVPILLRVSDTAENKALYQMLLDKGAAPPDLRRYIVEEKYGPLSQDEWQKFVKLSGSKLKSDVLANLASLNSTDPHGVKLFLNRAAQIANDYAAQSLHLTQKPTFSTAASTGGGSAVPALPKGNIGLPTTPRISLPGASLGGKSTRLSSMGGYGSPTGSGTTGFRRARTGRLSLSGLTGGQQRFVRGRLRARSTRLSRFRRGPRISTRRRSFRRRRISLRV